ncbi:hypothetical protein EC957_000157 [Mortierella hygrophila]|uniref:Crinkler effector protein N-terminal domain-containing protein n=1 Tax=Mortierella hygrophila TaxID=979708 RepID=A0A9P6FHX9_9FUNG|nr:hypothetical protein EC957_000157 [Mortierella hygrophila]
MARNRLSLLCLVDGDPISKAFALATPSAETFGQLRNTIYFSKPIWFKDLEAEDLTLWRVSIPVSMHLSLLKHLLLSLATSQVLRSQVWSMITPNAKLYVIDAYSSNLRVDLTRITDEFFAPGSDVTNFLGNFVRSPVNLPLTTGSVPGLSGVWLRNKGRLAKTYPNLLFLSLPDPTLIDTQSRYLTSDAILQLTERSPISIVPIFGVSGCGMSGQTLRCNSSPPPVRTRHEVVDKEKQ